MNEITKFETDYLKSLKKFPENINYELFKTIQNEEVRVDIVRRNKLLISDAYNRTMDRAKGVEQDGHASYTLSFRNRNYEYFVVDGVRSIMKEYFDVPLNKAEVDFAEQHFKEQKERGGSNLFNKNRWNMILENNDGYFPINIRAVSDGTLVKPHDPILVVSGAEKILDKMLMGSSEIGAHFEPKLLRIFYPSMVATHNHMIEELLGSGRVVDFSNRSSVNHLSEFASSRSMYIGGGINKTSNDGSSAVYPVINTTGTLAHRYFASFKIEDEAFENVLKKNPKNAIFLADYIDSYSGINKIIALKKKYPEINIFPRLDSGNILDQIRYYISQLDENNMSQAGEKLFISEVSSIENLQSLERTLSEDGVLVEDMIFYGIGGILNAYKKTRDESQGAFKQTMFDHKPTGKLSNDPNKEPIPGMPTIIITEEKKRIIAQLSEVIEGKIKGTDLLQDVVINGKHQFNNDDMSYIQQAREQVHTSKYRISYEQELSPLTQEYKNEVKNNLLAQKI